MNTPKFSSSVRFILIVLICLLVTIEPVLSQRKKSKSTKTVPVTSNILLADKGTTLYRIIIPSHPSPDVLKAAEILQGYILRISGAALPLISVEKNRRKSLRNSTGSE